MRAMGLETEVRQYDVFLPHPTSVALWRIAPRPRQLALAEPPVAGDPTSALASYPALNGYPITIEISLRTFSVGRVEMNVYAGSRGRFGSVTDEDGLASA